MHQYAGAALGAALLNWSRQSGHGIANIAPGLVLTPHDYVAPDVVWISRERLERGLRVDGQPGCAPEIVAEVLSPGSASERRDREAKRELYARAGITEYWLVDWHAHRIEIYRRADGELVPVVELADAGTII